MKLEIDQPYVLEKEDGQVALCANISTDDDKFTLWYAVPTDYAKYLCSELSDAFLVALLPWAMLRSTASEQMEIVCKAAISQYLYHQITRYYIPVLSKNISYYSKINIIAQIATEVLPSAKAVGTGISGGVDSSYTIAQYQHCENHAFLLTHGVYFDMGIYGGINSQSEQKIHQKVRKIADKVGLSFLKVTSNTCHVLYKKAHAPIVPSIFIGAILSLQKLFSVYYHSSTVTATDFKFSTSDAAYFDLFNVHCFSTANTKFYSSGIEATRLEKVSVISKAPFTYDTLTVCLSEDQIVGNCGRCAKCTRTMAQLEVLGKLDLYAESFDVKSFRADPGYHWGYILLKSKSDTFCREIRQKCREVGYNLPLIAYWSCLKKYVARGFTSENKKRERFEEQ